MTPRYAVGIDLGTSNSALAFADLAEPDPRIQVFEVPQLVDRSLTQPRNLLPSHLYLPSPHEGLGEVLVGAFARDREGRLLRSAFREEELLGGARCLHQRAELGRVQSLAEALLGNPGQREVHVVAAQEEVIADGDSFQHRRRIFAKLSGSFSIMGAICSGRRPRMAT